MALAACLLALLLCARPGFGQSGYGGTSVTTVTVTGSVSQGWSASMAVTVSMNAPSPYYCFVIGEDLGQPYYDVATITLANVTNSAILQQVGNPTAGVNPGYYGPGTYTATASYTGYSPGTDGGGDDCAVTGSSGSTTFTVAAPIGSQTTLTPSASSYVAGQPVQFQVNVMPPGGVVYPAAGGTVTLYYHETKLATATVGTGPITLPSAGIPPGTYPVTAAYSGDSNYLPSTGNASVTILPPQPTTVGLYVSPSPLVAGDVVELQASVTPGQPQLVPTGTVTFSADGKDLGTATVQNGLATLTRSSAGIAAGTYPVVAKYGGDANDLPATSAPVAVTVISQSATTTVMTIGPSLTLVQGDSADIGVTVTQATGNTIPSGSVNLLANGKTVSSLTLSGGAASMRVSTSGLAAGTYAVSAEYAGSKMDAASTSGVQQVQLLVTTATQLSASPNPVSQGGTTFLTAKVMETHGESIPTGTVTYSYQGTSLGTATLDSTGTGSLPLGTGGLSKGSYAMTATYSGDSENNVSTSDTLTVVVQ